jgi:hypothetical protein
MISGKRGERGARFMPDKAEKTDLPAKPRELPQPRRPSFQRVVEDIDKWANSTGLQKPT